MQSAAVEANLGLIWGQAANWKKAKMGTGSTDEPVPFLPKMSVWCLSPDWKKGQFGACPQIGKKANLVPVPRLAFFNQNRGELIKLEQHTAGGAEKSCEVTRKYNGCNCYSYESADYH